MTIIIIIIIIINVVNIIISFIIFITIIISIASQSLYGGPLTDGAQDGGTAGEAWWKSIQAL